jgi:hypothetical protein
VNGFYYRAMKLIVLCYESLGDEGVARFVYLHELGHGYTFQRTFDFTRWDGNYEAAADEFAAVNSVAQGHPEDLLRMARVFEAWGAGTPDPKDPHPPALERAQKMRRLYYGSQMPWGPLGAEWRDSLHYWRGVFLQEGA